MRYLLAAFMAAFFCLPIVQAGENHHAQRSGTNVYSSPKATSESESNSTSKSQAASQSTSESSSASDSNAQSSSGGNQQATNITNNQIKQAVGGYSEGTNTTAGCYYDQHAGLGTVFGGISFGHGRKDKDCEKRALAQELWYRGNIIGGNRVYCSIRTIKDTLGEDCEALLNEQTTKQVHSDETVISPNGWRGEELAPPNFVTHDELNTVIKKAMEK
jgi:hypothetical protein